MRGVYREASQGIDSEQPGIYQALNDGICGGRGYGCCVGRRRRLEVEAKEGRKRGENTWTRVKMSGGLRRMGSIT